MRRLGSKLSFPTFYKAFDGKPILTRLSHGGTLFLRSPRMWVWMMTTARNMDSVMSIMFIQKYAPARNIT